VIAMPSLKSQFHVASGSEGCGMGLLPMLARFHRSEVVVVQNRRRGVMSVKRRDNVQVLLWRDRFVAVLALAAVVGVASMGVLAPSSAVASVSRLTDPHKIARLAAHAYEWGLAPEFEYRFGNYNNLATAPRNTFGGGNVAAAWNNNATNAGNPSVLYLNSILDLSGQRRRGGTKELVLTVPPSKDTYYVVNMLDDFINTVGSIGTRTTPSTRAQTYLIVGPTSRYAHERTARIRGFAYRVVPFDTNQGQMLIRIRADTLAPASDPSSAASILKHVVKRFALSTLAQFEAHRHQPNYFKPGQYTPTQSQINRAAKWHNAPTHAVAFFKQMGESLRLNPLPDATTGLNGISLRTLPSWIVPQSGAVTRYRNPSYGQKHTLALFRRLGLTTNGFRIPRNWGPRQIAALQAGYKAGQKLVNDALDSVNVSAATNYWSYLNHTIGTYPNTPLGYLYRALVVLGGGGANVPLDGVYAQINNLDGTSNTQLDGNNTYTLTFTPPVTNPATLPVLGSLPPTVNDRQGNPRGFWSVSLYQTDATESAAPFITQASVLNTAYSTANIPVTAVDPSTDTLTVKPSAWGPLVKSSPILFSSTAAQYGLTPGIPYYVATTPTKHTDSRTNTTTYSFQVSATWQQQLSMGAGVPIQGNTGKPGPIVQLTNPGGAVSLQWGPIQPVSQLGSQQLASGKLVKNADGSVTIWISPTLPTGAPATNWIPTPSSAYYASIYPGVSVPTQIRPMIRIYYPTPGSNTQASILPPPNGSMGATYVFPALQKVG
jgi:hypothetical protein